MNDVLLSLGWALVHFIWQGALLGIVTAALLALLRNARPQLRYAVACTALAMCIVLPALDVIGYGNDNQLDFVAAGVADAFDGNAAQAEGLDSVIIWVQANLMFIVAIWALCVGLFSMRLVFGLVWVARISAVTHSAANPWWQARVNKLAQRMQLKCDIALRVVRGLNTPAVVGWWRPVVLVPASLICGMQPDLLEALLAHEVAHIKRFDYLVNLLQSVVEILLFYHPTVWWLSRRIRIEREQIADDLAAGILGEPRRLALALRELAHTQFSTTHLAQAAHGGNLMYRIQRLIRPNVQALNWKTGIPAIGILLAGIAFCANASVSDPAPAALAAASVKPAFVDLNSCKPEYPPESLKNNETGTVTISFLIDSKGHLARTRLDKSSGHTLLDNETIAALGKCAFKPGTKNGKAVRSWLNAEYVWKLEE